MGRFPAFGDGPDYERRLIIFRPQNTGQPIKDRGNNVAVARGGSAGLFTFTFAEADRPKGFAGIDFSMGNNLANDLRVTGAGYVESTGVLTLTCFADKTTGAAAADIAIGATNIVWLWVYFVGNKKI